MQTSHKDVIWKKHENKTLWALQRRKDSVDGRNAFYAVFLYSNWKRNSYYDGRNTGKLAGLPLCSIREKGYGVSHFTELHRTLHKTSLSGVDKPSHRLSATDSKLCLSQLHGLLVTASCIRTWGKHRFHPGQRRTADSGPFPYSAYTLPWPR